MISQSRVTAAADETFAIMITNVPLNAHPMLSSESRSIASLKRARLRLQSRCLAPVQHHLLPATCYLLPVTREGAPLTATSYQLPEYGHLPASREVASHSLQQPRWTHKAENCRPHAAHLRSTAPRGGRNGSECARCAEWLMRVMRSIASVGQTVRGALQTKARVTLSVAPRASRLRKERRSERLPLRLRRTSQTDARAHCRGAARWTEANPRLRPV